MKFFALIILTSLLFIGCGSNSTIITNHKYDDKDYWEKYMFIAPIANDAINIPNTIGFSKKVMLKQKKSLKDLINKSIMNYTVGYVDGIKINRSAIDSSLFLSQLDTSKFLCISKAIDNDTTLYKFYIPRKEILQQNNIKANVAAVINEISFKDGFSYSPGHYTPGTTVNTPGGSFSTPGTFSGGFSYPMQEIGISFIFYDYDENEIITYGISHIKVPMEWEAAGRELAKELFKATPFKYSATKHLRNAQHISTN